MAAYVDSAGVFRRGRRWNHLAADGMEELHAFAASIGLKRAWFHDGDRHPHYDVTDAQRALAVASGARPVGKRELARAARRLAVRGEGHAG